MKRKNRCLSSEALKRKRIERERKSGTDPGGEIQKGSTCQAAVGAKQGRTKGNKQKAEYLELEGRQERSGRRERETGEAKAETGTEEATVRREREEKERKKQRLSSEMLTRKRLIRKRKSGTGPGGEI